MARFTNDMHAIRMATGMAFVAFVDGVFMTIAILIILIILDFVQFGIIRRGIYLLRFQIIPTDTDDSSFEEVFKRLLATHSRLSIKTVRMGQFVEHSYLVKLQRGISDQQLISSLSALEGMERVILLSEESESEL